MDTPADPATPFAEVYQAFLADLAKEGTEADHPGRSGTSAVEDGLDPDRAPNGNTSKACLCGVIRVRDTGLLPALEGRL